MGTEIDAQSFSSEDFEEFNNRLRQETDILSSWCKAGFAGISTPKCGFELEAWLVTPNAQPAPRNDEFLDQLDSPLVVPELARFNFEINSTPHPFGSNLLSRLYHELKETWAQCEQAAATIGAIPLMTGILPTLKDSELCMSNVSSMKRYTALNHEVIRRRNGRPLQICIKGDNQRLQFDHYDVMAEAATTSLQVHLQVSADDAVDMYNAAQIISAPLLAATSNSPYLFETELWAETRIPLFEQSVAVPPWQDLAGNAVQRVTFGSHYVQDSLIELFVENRDCIPVLLPMLWDDPPEKLRHLRLHNGTIWRWNRPLIGVEDGQAPHMRVEIRPVAAGPSIVDVIANIALTCGLVTHMRSQLAKVGCAMPFDAAKRNFYRAARLGLAAQLEWFGKACNARDLLLHDLLPAARSGLQTLGFDEQDIMMFFDEIILPRVTSRQTGAMWQRTFIQRHGPDFQRMTERLIQQQQSRLPVHQWTY